MTRTRSQFLLYPTALAASIAVLSALAGTALAQDKTSGQVPATSRRSPSNLDGGKSTVQTRQLPDAIGHTATEAGSRASTSGPAPASAGRATRQFDLMIDPFEVSSQLRESRSRSPFAGLPNVNVLELKRRVHLRAVLRTAQGTLAQLLINNKDIVTIMDKELVDLGDLGTFQAEIQSGTVSLSNPNNPQGKKVVLR